VIDASTWAGQWPFAIHAHRALPETAERLAAIGVSRALISPVRAVFAPDPMDCNHELRCQIANAGLPAGFRFSLVPIVNPALPGWRTRLEAFLRESGETLAAIKVVPNYHGYALGERPGAELAAAITSLGIPVCIQMRMQDERSHHSLVKVPAVPIDDIIGFARGVPDVAILVCGAYNAELPRLAAAPNLHAELSFVESGNTLPNALNSLNGYRLLFATHTPIHDPVPGIAKLWGEHVSDATVRDVSTGNANRLFGE
jgi:predicted TIM-barrel fold metal-dependent hydrolase